MVLKIQIIIIINNPMLVYKRETLIFGQYVSLCPSLDSSWLEVQPGYTQLKYFHALRISLDMCWTCAFLLLFFFIIETSVVG